MIIGQVIRHERIKRGLTQKDVSSGVCAISYLSLVENGKMIPNEEIASMLLKKLGLDKETLSTKEYNSVKVRLDEWYDAIRKRDFKMSNELSTSFQKDYKTGFHDPMLQTYFLLILLRHKVLHSNLRGVKGVLTQLSQLKDYLNNNTLIFYYHTLGYYEYEHGNPNTSILLLKKAKKLSDQLSVNEPDLNYHSALTYLKLQDSPNVLLSSNLALNEYQNEVNLLRIIDCNILMGIANRKIGNLEEAQHNFKSLLSYSLSNEQKGKVLHNLGHLYYKSGNYSKAVETLQKTIKVKQGNIAKVITYYLLSRVYLEKGDIQAAETIFLEGKKLLNEKKLRSLSIKYKLLEYQLMKTEQYDQYIEFLLNEAIPFFEEHEIDYAKEYLIVVAGYLENKRCYKEANQLLRRALKL